MEIKNENGYVIQVKYTRWHIRCSRHSIDIITFMDHIRCVFMLMKSKTKPQWEIKWEREKRKITREVALMKSNNKSAEKMRGFQP